MTDVSVYIIQKRGDKWVLISKDGGKVLGTHETKEDAEKQERAIQAQKNMSDKTWMDIPAVQKIYKSHPELEKPKDIQTYDIEGVDIFAPGVWNGDKYTVKDLDVLVENFKKTKDHLKPYLKLGHGKKQKLLSEDELPAAGFISNLRRIGHKLVADFVNMPEKIYQLVRRKAYNRISSEIFNNVNINGKSIGKALKAVALLGGETPAVSTLDDILTLYASCGEARVYSEDAEYRTYELDAQKLNEKENPEMEDKVKELEKELAAKEAELETANEKVAKFLQDKPEEDKKRLQAMIDDLKKRMALLKTDKEAMAVELEKLKKENGASQKKLAEVEKEKKLSEVTATVEKLITDKKLAPAHKEKAHTLLMTLSEGEVKKFAFGEGESTPAEAIVKLLSEGADIEINTEEESEPGSRQKSSDKSDLAAKAKKYAAEHKVSDREALMAVAE